MSMHEIPLSTLEEMGLRRHGLTVGSPSQLSDVFRQGVAWVLSQQAAQPVPPIDMVLHCPKCGLRHVDEAEGEDMSTTDDIMAMRKACDMQGLSQEFEDLVAERDEWRKLRDPVNLHCNLLRGIPSALTREQYLHLAGCTDYDSLVAERDLAIHEQDMAQESLRRHEVWLQAERDALKSRVERMEVALMMVRMLRSCGGMLPGVRELILSVCDEADAAMTGEQK